MTVKDRVGRVRHVAFRVTPAEPGPSIRRNDVVGALRGVIAHEFGRDVLDRLDPKLTIWTGEYGIVRVPHTGRDELVQALRAITWVGAKEREVRVETLGTSGTIRGAKRFLPAAERPPRTRPRKR